MNYFYYGCDFCEKISTDKKKSKIISCVENFVNLSLNQIEEPEIKYRLKLIKGDVEKKIVLGFDNDILKENVWFDSQIYISNFRKKTKELENLIQKKNILSIIKKHFSNPDQKLEWVDYFSKTNYLQDDQNTCCLIPFSRLDIQDECNFASDEIVIYQHPIMCILIKRILWDTLSQISKKQKSQCESLPVFLNEKYNQLYDEKTTLNFCTFALCIPQKNPLKWKSVCIIQIPSNEKYKNNIEVEWTDILCFPFHFLV